MAYSIGYKIVLKNVEQNDVVVNIYDTESPQADETLFTTLEGGADPILIGSIDNSESKLHSIRGMQATITFISDDQNDLETFSTGSDNRFKVECILGSQIIFEGFLTLEDNVQLFVDGRKEVVLTATDKLGSLREAVYTDFDGNNPRGHYTIAQLCAFALRKTGLSLPIKVVNNLVHGSGSREATNIIFNASTNRITVSFNLDFFYEGMTLRISGSPFNSGVYQVLGFFSSNQVIVDKPLVNESATIYLITFTDESSAGHIFEKYLDALTFEDDINECVEPYEVLERIIGKSMSLFYYQQAWWIIRHSERYLSTLRVAVYDADGEFVEYQTIDTSMDFGFNEPHWFSEAATEISPSRPIGESRVEYSYEFPKELICNIDFERGDVITPPDMTAPSSEGRYEVDCWTLHRYGGGSPTSIMYIRKIFNYGYEKERGLLITPADTSSETTWAQSSPMFIKKGDRFSVDVEFKSLENFGSGEGAVEYDIVFIWIVDVNGGLWYWTDLDMGGSSKGYYSWEGPFLSEQNRPVSTTWILGDTNETDPQSVNADCGAAPVTGMLYFGLPQLNQTGSSFDDNVHVVYNLSFEYKPLINGSYETFSGESHSVVRSVSGYNKKEDHEEFIADAPTPLFKGGILYDGGLTYLTTIGRWRMYNDNSIIKPYLWWVVFDIWNQYKNAITSIEVNANGLSTTPPWHIHAISVKDSNGLTAGRLFELLNFEISLRMGRITGTMPEVWRESGYSYDDTYNFKYIT